MSGLRGEQHSTPPEQFKSGRQTYRRLLGYVKPHWRVFSLSIVGMLVFASTEPLFAAMIKPLLDGSFVDRDPQVVRLMPFLLVGILPFAGLPVLSIPIV